MNTLIPDRPALIATVNERARWTAQQYADAIAKNFTLSLEWLATASQLVVEAERKGLRFEGLSRKDEQRLAHLRRIGLGTQLPETYINLMGHARLRDIIAELSLDEQQRLADGGTVKLVVQRANGKTEILESDPRELLPEQIDQVFAHGRIRTESEQVTWLFDRANKARRPVPQTVGPLEIDEELFTASSKGRVTLTEQDLATALSIIRKLKKRTS